jgi:predicted transcriptional regulator
MARNLSFRYDSIMEILAKANTTVTANKKIYTGVAARAMKLQAGGANQREVANALGVDESLISQYNAEADYKEQLHELVSKAFKSAQEIDENYQHIEHTLSSRLKELSQYMMNPDQVLRTLKFTNEAKRKLGSNLANGNGSHTGSDGTKLTPVVLVLPVSVKREFVLNPNNEIIGVDEDQLVTLNSSSLNAMIAKRKEALKEVPKLTNGNQSRERHDPYSDL